MQAYPIDMGWRNFLRPIAFVTQVKEAQSLVFEPPASQQLFKEGLLMNHSRIRVGLALATTALLGLAACGGGSDSTPVTTTFSGTAATGAALANATVSITCASGSGSTNTSTDGSYTKDLTGITLPCALKAASSDGTTVLYSVTSATATGSNTQVANITPLTQLLVASLAGAEPAAFFDGFSASTASSVTDSAINTAQTAVLNTLSEAGIDVSGLSATSLVSGALVPGSTANAYDVALEALGAKLESSGTTLALLTTTVATTSTATGPASTSPATANVASLPAAQLLNTADSNCSALRSGNFWAISPVMGGNLADQYTSGSYNASTKTATNLVGGSTIFTDASDKCKYGAAGGSDIVVSQAGMVVARYRDDSNVYRLGIAIPKQTIALSELAGTWNALGFERERTAAGDIYEGNSFTVTISSTGAVSDITACNGASTSSTCSAITETINFSSNSAGGFDLIGSDASGTWTDRAFAYRAGNGDLMIVEVSGDGSVSVFTKKRTLILPAVDSVQSGSWSIRTLSTLVANQLAVSYPATVTAVNSAADGFTRTVNLANGTVDYSEPVLINSPRAGYNFRAASSTTSASIPSRTVNIRERTSLGLRGMGVSVQSVPVQAGVTSAGFQVTVDQR